MSKAILLQTGGAEENNNDESPALELAEQINSPKINRQKENQLIVENAKWDLTPYEKLPKVGVLDPEGLQPNPFTGQPYSEKYHELSKIWAPFPFNEQKNQKKTFEILQKNQIMIVKAGTGTGKSSQVPKFVSHLLGYKGRIAITVPTQASARTGADFMAISLDVTLGNEIGYKFRGDKMIDQNQTYSRVVFTTDGSILAQMLGNDPMLSNLNALIIDEAHKRSTNIDLILLLAKEVMRKRPDFKLIIISATIDVSLFAKYYDKEFKVGIMEVPGKTSLYTVKDVWLDKPLTSDRADVYIKAAVKRVIEILTTSNSGDILVFMPSTSDVMRSCQELRMENKEGLSFCLEATGGILRGSKEYLKKVTDPDETTDKRKVIMSTNVAEESITIKNLDYVIDTGLKLQDGYNPKRMARSLLKEFITQASALQRRGRTGRKRDGTCYHLYTQKQFQNFPQYDEPEIRTTNLSSIVLSITKMPLVQTYKKTINMLNQLIEPPSKERILSALLELKALGVFSGTKITDLGEITPIGTAMAQLAIEPGLAKSLLMAHHYHVRTEMSFLIALIEAAPNETVTNYIRRPNMKKGEDRSTRAKALKPFLSKRGDYFTALKIFHAWEKYREKHEAKEVAQWAYENYINQGPLKKVKGKLKRNIPRYRRIFRPNNQPNLELEEALKKAAKKEPFKSQEANVVQALKEGEGAIRSAKLMRGDEYKTDFPPEKTKARLNRDTMLPKGERRKREIMYGELFMGTGPLTFNNVTFL